MKEMVGCDDDDDKGTGTRDRLTLGISSTGRKLNKFAVGASLVAGITAAPRIFNALLGEQKPSASGSGESFFT